MSGNDPIEDSERRNNARLMMSGDVEYAVLGHDASIESTHAKNISTGGICLSVSEKIEKGTVLSLKISLPNEGTPVIVKGKVMWCAGFTVKEGQSGRCDVGVEFIDVEGDQRKKILQYVFSQLKTRGT